MKIYIVTSGEYSDYHIDAVFTDKRKAEIYAANHSNIYYDANVEEYEADECQVDGNTDVYVIHKFTASYGRLEFCRVKYSTKKESNKVTENLNQTRAFIDVSLNEYNEEKATKIAQDMLAQYRAAKLGL